MKRWSRGDRPERIVQLAAGVAQVAVLVVEVIQELVKIPW
jgi:hypothetical protein